MRRADTTVGVEESVDDVVERLKLVPADVMLVVDADQVVGYVEGRSILDIASKPHLARELVGNVMQTDVVACRPQDNMGEAVELLKRLDAVVVAVVDARLQVQGWLHRRDLLDSQDNPR